MTLTLPGADFDADQPALLLRQALLAGSDNDFEDGGCEFACAFFAVHADCFGSSTGFPKTGEWLRQPIGVAATGSLRSQVWVTMLLGMEKI